MTLCFPQWLHQFTNPPTVHKGFLFPTSLPIFVLACLAKDGCSNKHEVLSHCGFDLHFPNDFWCCIFYMYLLSICIYSLGKISIWFTCPILKNQSHRPGMDVICLCSSQAQWFCHLLDFAGGGTEPHGREEVSGLRGAHLVLQAVLLNAPTLLRDACCEGLWRMDDPRSACPSSSTSRFT